MFIDKQTKSHNSGFELLSKYHTLAWRPSGSWGVDLSKPQTTLVAWRIPTQLGMYKGEIGCLKNSNTIRDLQRWDDVGRLKNSNTIRDLQRWEDVGCLKNSNTIRDLQRWDDVGCLKNSNTIRDLQRWDDVGCLKNSNTTRDLQRWDGLQIQITMASNTSL